MDQYFLFAEKLCVADYVGILSCLAWSFVLALMRFCPCKKSQQSSDTCLPLKSIIRREQNQLVHSKHITLICSLENTLKNPSSHASFQFHQNPSLHFHLIQYNDMPSSFGLDRGSCALSLEKEIEVFISVVAVDVQEVIFPSSFLMPILLRLGCTFLPSSL
mmetsp:Transcript_50718/g.122342  ORF Transcript_50718/g.122342 Transcript_50718/m.122342 type:complete len:161 (+) Transcript_50718:100-582(+)